MNGKFIVFEGVDNSGKTTVATQISDWLLNSEQINTLITKHPGSTPVGQEIRTILKHSEHPINPTAQALLFAADNSMFINQILKPNINNGTWVIGDRNNFISSLAYQIASGCSWDELDKVHDATGQIIKIDLLIIFYCGWKESQRRKKLKDNLKRTVLRAPVDGLIKFLYHSTIGGIVKPGGTVVDIVPEGDKLLIEAQLPVQEVIYVASGQIAKVRPLTPDAANFGQLEGRVVHVSPDSIREADKIPFYLITIELESEFFKSKGKRYPLLPGIQVTCSIRTGDRSILDYLISPFMDITSTALRER